MKDHLYARVFAAFKYRIIKYKNKWSSGVNSKKNDGFRMFLAGLCKIALDLGKRWLFIISAVIIPTLLFVEFRPGLENYRDTVCVITWFFIITLGESYVYTKIYNITNNDETLIKVFKVDYKDTFLGKFSYDVISKCIFDASALLIFRIGIYNVIALLVLTLSFKAIGERRRIKRFNKAHRTINKSKYKKGNAFFTFAMMIAAYATPLILGENIQKITVVVHPIVVAVVGAKSILDYRYLFKYKYYGNIERELLYGSNYGR